jgi:hypothetical protein
MLCTLSDQPPSTTRAGALENRLFPLCFFINKESLLHSNHFNNKKKKKMWGRLFHLTADAVLISAVLAGIKRNAGLQ